MSQHVYETTHNADPVRVLMGWDRPLQYFFMTVMRTDEAVIDDSGDDDDDDGDDTMVYDNLADPLAFHRPLSYFKDKLVELGIRVPTRMFEEVQADAEKNAGNRYCIHSDAGFEEAMV